MTLDPAAGQRAHSAVVEMDLILADRVLPIAQMGPEFPYSIHAYRPSAV